MPSFDFNFAPKKSKRKTAKSNSGTEIIESNVIGCVWVDCNGSYTVKVNDTHYKISKDSYNCKGKQVIYRHGEGDRARFAFVRAIDNMWSSHNIWLPFTVGSIVKGNIVVVHPFNFTYFVIKRIGVGYKNEHTKAALEYYRKHIKEINDSIRKYRQ